MEKVDSASWPSVVLNSLETSQGILPGGWQLYQSLPSAPKFVFFGSELHSHAFKNFHCRESSLLYRVHWRATLLSSGLSTSEAPHHLPPSTDRPHRN